MVPAAIFVKPGDPRWLHALAWHPSLAHPGRLPQKRRFQPGLRRAGLKAGAPHTHGRRNGGHAPVQIQIRTRHMVHAGPGLRWQRAAHLPSAGERRRPTLVKRACSPPCRPLWTACCPAMAAHGPTSAASLGRGAAPAGVHQLPDDVLIQMLGLLEGRDRRVRLPASCRSPPPPPLGACRVRRPTTAPPLAVPCRRSAAMVSRRWHSCAHAPELCRDVSVSAEEESQQAQQLASFAVGLAATARPACAAPDHPSLCIP